MAQNPNAVGKKHSECTETDSLQPEGGEPPKNSTATSATANQNGDQPGCGDGVMPEQEGTERRRNVQVDVRTVSGSLLPGQRPTFQIPRKTRERKGLYNFLPPDSREFEDLVKTVSSCYLDSSSRGTFTYCKARLIRNELLEKEFIEKRREMKQEGRTEQELSESFCFLFPDKSKLQWICEKGLAVGHSRITTLGNPSVGVYLSKHSDLLQINPFEVGSYGDMIVFKVMRGRVKHIHENMPKNAIEPSPKFDSHLSKSANRVTSLLSYRAFELTQQYFFEFAFDEIKARPRHVCPYAVVSFQYKGKEAAVAPMTAHRFNTLPSETSRGKSCYTVWSGPLVNKGQELFPIFLRSSTRPYLPFKLPEKLEVTQGMQLEQVKRKIPSVLFSWDTYTASREVMKCGMSCSLFDVVDGKGKPTSGSLAALVNKLERDRMVLVKSLYDRGFLFLLSSTQMVESKERWGRQEKSLHALFIFQESRAVVKYSSRLCEPAPLTVEPQPSGLTYIEPFVPALHYALFKLRPNPGKDLSSGVDRHSADYLSRIDSGTVRPFILPDYKSNMDDRTSPLQVPRPKFNMDSTLRAYIHNPASYHLPLNKVKEIVERGRSPVPAATAAPAVVEYSPVSDWGGSDRGDKLPEKVLQERPQQEQPTQEKPPPDDKKQRPRLPQSNGAQLPQKFQAEPQTQPPPKLRLSQNEYDKDKMKQLLKLIQQHKKALVKDPGKDRGEDAAWDTNSLKRKFEGDEKVGANKHQRLDPICNGESSRGLQADDLDVGQKDNLTAVMESMGIYGTDLRTHANDGSTAVNETQRLLKILLTTLKKAVSQGSLSVQSKKPSAGSVLESDTDLKQQKELVSQTNYTEEDMDCSPGSPFSPGSSQHLEQTSEDPSWVKPANEERAQPFPELEPKSEAAPVPTPEVLTASDGHPEPKASAGAEVRKVAAPSTLASVEEAPSRPSISLDTILNQEVYSLTSDIKNIMQSHHISYTSQLPPRLTPRHGWLPSSCFSQFVVPYISPVPCQGHVKALCEKMERLIPPLPVSSGVASPVPPLATSSLATPPSTPNQSSKTKPEAPVPKSGSCSHSGKTAPLKELKSTRAKAEAPPAESGGEVYSPSQVPPDVSESKAQNLCNASGGGDSGLLAGSLIGQLKPEVFSSLVEIFKDVTKNTVKFYIHSGDEWEKSAICKDIKEYLKSLGNSECSPQTFLENSSSLDKLLIIIKNEDIAAHVHKIPALVSLKKLPSVSFAGVDSLDDVKNHTYNELFVSGGFIVSDEFVLNPELITQDRLQGLLKFLEEQSTPEHPWHWKVHCKSQKKLKELGRLSTNAMGLLNLLTAYQKKHLVEFLPYHECDNQSRQAPDLECLIKLQAQHTQQRHLIFLTERPFEMFLQYSRNGIVIGSIDDVMSGFHSLIGSINQNELPTPPSTVNEECVEEDMSLDSDDGEPPDKSDSLEQKEEVGEGKPPLPPPPDADRFCPPLPEKQSTPETATSLSDFNALKTAISQFKASSHLGIGSSDVGSLSPGGFTVNPHQSFLYPSASWSSYTGSSGFSASPAYPSSPCNSSHEPEYRPPPTAPAPVPAASVAVAPPGPLANLASLPLEVKPPPPPHLMLQGHTYGSDTGATGTTGKSPHNTSLPYADHNDSAQPGFQPAITNQLSALPVTQERTLCGPGEGVWGPSGATTCETVSSQVAVTSGLLDPSTLPTTGEPIRGNTPSSQVARTQMNCTDNLGTTVGMPAVASRGGSLVRPKMPPHPMSGMGFSMPGQMNHAPMRGGVGPGNFRGRGIFPLGLWPRPGRGHDRGGGSGSGPCSWGYPGGRGQPQDYYSYSHYAPE